MKGFLWLFVFLVTPSPIYVNIFILLVIQVIQYSSSTQLPATNSVGPLQSDLLSVSCSLAPWVCCRFCSLNLQCLSPALLQQPFNQTLHIFFSHLLIHFMHFCQIIFLQHNSEHVTLCFQFKCLNLRFKAIYNLDLFPVYLFSFLNYFTQILFQSNKTTYSFFVLYAFLSYTSEKKDFTIVIPFILFSLQESLHGQIVPGLLESDQCLLLHIVVVPFLKSQNTLSILRSVLLFTQH